MESSFIAKNIEVDGVTVEKNSFGQLQIKSPFDDIGKILYDDVGTTNLIQFDKLNKYKKLKLILTQTSNNSGAYPQFQFNENISSNYVTRRTKANGSNTTTLATTTFFTSYINGGSSSNWGIAQYEFIIIGGRIIGIGSNDDTWGDCNLEFLQLKATENFFNSFKFNLNPCSRIKIIGYEK